jgi:hydrogenase-4 membrane subunit HyfE
MPGATVIPQVAVLLSYLTVIMALLISASSTLKQMVQLYQAQAWLLTVVVLLTSLEPGRIQVAVAALALLPAALAVLVPPLLARASVTRVRRTLRGQLASVELIWLQHGSSRLRGGQSAAVDMLLIATAVLVAYRLVRGVGGIDADDVVPNLAVTIALVLQGLFTMGNKRDIIAQVIGLLVIEHGLFLAAVRVAPSELAFLFVLSLFFYVLVTLVILLWILPQLHRASRSIEVSDHSRLKG